jgi:hypothetical protein
MSRRVDVGHKLNLDRREFILIEGSLGELALIEPGVALVCSTGLLGVSVDGDYIFHITQNLQEVIPYEKVNHRERQIAVSYASLCVNDRGRARPLTSGSIRTRVPSRGVILKAHVREPLQDVPDRLTVGF